MGNYQARQIRGNHVLRIRKAGRGNDTGALASPDPDRQLSKSRERETHVFDSFSPYPSSVPDWASLPDVGAFPLQVALHVMGEATPEETPYAYITWGTTHRTTLGVHSMRSQQLRGCSREA